MEVFFSSRILSTTLMISRPRSHFFFWKCWKTFDKWWHLWIKKAKTALWPNYNLLMLQPTHTADVFFLDYNLCLHYFSCISPHVAFDLHQCKHSERHNLTSHNGRFNVNSLRLKRICVASFETPPQYGHTGRILFLTPVCRCRKQLFTVCMWPHVTTAGAGLHIENNNNNRTALLCFGL